MDRLEGFTKIASVAAVLLATFAGGRLEGYVKSLGLPSPIEVLLLIAVILLVYVAVAEGAAQLVRNSRWLRRAIMGHQFIEGTWIDLILDGSRVAYVGVLRIVMDAGKLSISGENHDRNGTPVSSFHSTLPDFSWPLVRFLGWPDRRDSVQSYSEIRFDAREGVPLRYKGFYLDFGSSDRRDYAGWRVTDANLLKRLDDPGHVRQVIVDVVASAETAVVPTQVNGGEKA